MADKARSLAMPQSLLVPPLRKSFAGRGTLGVVLRHFHLAGSLTAAASVQDRIVLLPVPSALRVDPRVSRNAVQPPQLHTLLPKPSPSAPRDLLTSTVALFSAYQFCFQPVSAVAF